jgi:HSP20 family protein
MEGNMRNTRALVPSLLNELQGMQDFFDFPFEGFSSLAKVDGSGVTVYEDDKNIFVEAQVPGIKPEDVEVNFEKGVLWVKGETKKERGDVKYHLKSSESFSYRIPVPSHIDEGAMPEATYKDGIIKVSFKKAKISQPKKIQVKEVK